MFLEENKEDVEMMEDVKKLEEMVFEFFEVEIEFVFKEVND